MSKPWVPVVVQQGDHLGKLAFRHGADAETVWKHDKNKELAARRKNPDMLCPGDVLYLPTEPAPPLHLAPGAANRYRARIPTVPVSIRLATKRRSVANQPFEVHGAVSGD